MAIQHTPISQFHQEIVITCIPLILTGFALQKPNNLDSEEIVCKMTQGGINKTGAKGSKGCCYLSWSNYTIKRYLKSSIVSRVARPLPLSSPKAEETIFLFSSYKTCNCELNEKTFQCRLIFSSKIKYVPPSPFLLCF